jgi:hypothetical protein
LDDLSVLTILTPVIGVSLALNLLWALVTLLGADSRSELVPLKTNRFILLTIRMRHYFSKVDSARRFCKIFVYGTWYRICRHFHNSPFFQSLALSNAGYWRAWGW